MGLYKVRAGRQQTKLRAPKSLTRTFEQTYTQKQTVAAPSLYISVSVCVLVLFSLSICTNNMVFSPNTVSLLRSSHNNVEEDEGLPQEGKALLAASVQEKKASVASACIQHYWRRSFRFKTTKELMKNYLAHGPWSTYVKSIR